MLASRHFIVIIWAVIFVTLSKGVQSGIEKVSKLAMPLLIGLFLVITFRGLSLEGASLGLNHFFTPDCRTKECNR
ncbi:hypothetical protein BEP19_16490 [Ammoniphilus oxalaticus]|uniref:Uncharacterized protein n=1 Tax=Ammoniphilus oxalaticus TaxID=66863 RepID=A0A419SQL2_9BACL|nr:hypothetical protein BEP19_16490 [Ammoniphilus oxalaticus]